MFRILLLVILDSKKAKKNEFYDPEIVTADNKNAIETFFLVYLGPQKSMGGIVIDILEKSNFFGSIGSQKGAENLIFIRVGHLNPPLMVGLRTQCLIDTWSLNKYKN